MNVDEVLKMADALVFAKTGQHLDDLQQAIARGTLQGKKYSEIAQEKHCNESYVRDVGAKLWQILSKELEEEVTEEVTKVTKSNFRSTMERLQFSLFSSNVAQDSVQIRNINICGEIRQPPDTPNQNPQNQETSNPQKNLSFHHDLSKMPKLGSFYNRTAELELLKKQILTKKHNF